MLKVERPRRMTSLRSCRSVTRGPETRTLLATHMDGRRYPVCLAAQHPSQPVAMRTQMLQFLLPPFLDSCFGQTKASARHPVYLATIYFARIPLRCFITHCHPTKLKAVTHAVYVCRRHTRTSTYHTIIHVVYIDAMEGYRTSLNKCIAK